MRVDLDELPTGYEINELATLLDEDNMASFAKFVRQTPALIAELRAARECVQLLRLQSLENVFVMPCKPSVKAAIAAYDATKGAE